MRALAHKDGYEKVLVVDDEREVLTAIEDALEDEYDILTTDDPGSALEIIERDYEVSVIITDQRMPRMTGDELLARARKHTEASRILITGFSDLDAVVRAINDGKIFGYVSKPWDPEALRMLVYRAAEHFKLKQEVLHERDLLRSLMDNMPDAIYFKDAEFRYTRVNPVHARLLGLDDPADAEGQPASRFVDEKRNVDIEGDERNLLSGGKPIVDRISRIVDVEGDVRWMSVTKVPTQDPDGSVNGVVAVARDVSQRLRIEQELRQSEAGLRHAENLARLGHRHWNQAERRFEGWSQALLDLVGLTEDNPPFDMDEWLDLVTPEDRDRVQLAYRAARNHCKQVKLQYQLRRISGRLIHVEELFEPMDGDEGEFWFSTVQDVTVVVRQQQELRLLLTTTRAVAESENQTEAMDRVLREVCEQSGWHYGEIWMPDASGRLICQPEHYASSEQIREYRTATEALFSAPGEGLVGKVWESGRMAWHPDIERFEEGEFRRLHAAQQSGITGVALFPVLQHDRKPVAVLGFALLGGHSPDRSFAEVVAGVAAQLGTCFERLHAIQRLSDSEQRFRNLAAHLPGIIFKWVTRADGEEILDYISPKTKSMLGVAPEHLQSVESWAAILHPDDVEGFRGSIDQAVANEGSWKQEFRVIRNGDEVRWMWAQSSPTMLDNGDLVYDGIILDVTERKQAEEQVRFLQQFDELTGLPNRHLLADRLNRALDAAEKGAKIGVVQVSLDQYTSIADTLGHDDVDELLRRFSERVEVTLEDRQTMGRIGNNDFVLVLPQQASLDDVAGSVRQLQEHMREPFKVGEQEIHVNLSIGIAVAPDNGADANGLLRDSGAALDRVCASGGDGYQFFTREMTERATRRLSLDTRLRKALDNEEFELYYQPILEVNGSKIVSAEALIRWRQLDGTVVSPGEFIPLAEETGLILPMGEWTLHEASRHIAKLDESCPGLGRIHINVSARQVLRSDILKQVRHAAAGAGIRRDRIELELTESAVMEQLDHAKAIIKAAHQDGIHIAIDDFGTGYSSLGYLRELQVDTLKLDQSFIASMTADPKAGALVNAIITMAHGFDMEVVAEGVEDEQQLTFLRAYRCDYAQGFYFHKAMPFSEFLELVGPSK